MKNLLVSVALTLMVFGCSSHTNNQAAVDIPVGLEIGNKAPALSFNSPDDTTIALSELSGKLVLIDFWASWCPPCRKENPNLVAAYKTFQNDTFKNGNGFTIYSVSFDKKKDAWLNAIRDDSLFWPYHVSDLKGWEAEASYTYDINSIPSNVLIDGDGIILAKDLRGESLVDTLETLRL